MKTVTLVAPSHWSNFLINQDDSGLEASEVSTIQEWMLENRLDFPVSCDDAGFRWKHDASFYAQACDCQSYLFFDFDSEQPELIDHRPLCEILDDTIPF
jgi:hypothetical protein